MQEIGRTIEEERFPESPRYVRQPEVAPSPTPCGERVGAVLASLLGAYDRPALCL